VRHEDDRAGRDESRLNGQGGWSLVATLVGVSKNRAARLRSVGFSLPARIQIRAELDTGSFVTGLPPSVFAFPAPQ
jgi:hypothetical protein